MLEREKPVKTLEPLYIPRHFMLRDGGDPTIMLNEDRENAPFTPEAVDALTGFGFVMYPLTRSIATIERQGGRFASPWVFDYLLQHSLPQYSVVAIRPGDTLVFKDEKITIAGQVLTYRDKYNIPDTKAVIGRAADVADLAFTHLEATGEYLLGEEHGSPLVYTKTPGLQTGEAIHVGGHHKELGLRIQSLPAKPSTASQALVMLVPA